MACDKFIFRHTPSHIRNTRKTIFLMILLNCHTASPSPTPPTATAVILQHSSPINHRKKAIRIDDGGGPRGYKWICGK